MWRGIVDNPSHPDQALHVQVPADVARPSVASLVDDAMNLAASSALLNEDAERVIAFLDASGALLEAYDDARRRMFLAKTSSRGLTKVLRDRRS